MAAPAITAAEDDVGAGSNCTTQGRRVTSRPTNKTSPSLLPPVSLNIANQQGFQAIRLGSLAIRMPNGGAGPELVLRKVLHAPSAAYTLVSLGELDAEGYRTNIGSGTLEIVDPYSQRVGRVAYTSRRLYRVAHTLKRYGAAPPPGAITGG